MSVDVSGLEAKGLEEVEPPSSSISSFVVGRDSEGRWLAVEIHGRAGGFFSSQYAAERFAAAETAHRKGAISLANGPIRLRMS